VAVTGGDKKYQCWDQPKAQSRLCQPQETDLWMHSISHSREIPQETYESKTADFLLGSRSSWMLRCISLCWGDIKRKRG